MHLSSRNLLLLVALLLAASASAQSLDGTIRGRVLDASGSAIAQAQITLRDADKGVSFATRSDALGLYQAELPRGTYELEASAPGFASVRRTGVLLSLGSTVALDLTLPVGGARESIDVRAEPPLIDTASGALSGLVDRERLAELPLNGRDFGSLALLQPGVVLNNNGANSPFGGKWANFIINGQLDQATLFLLDGSEITDTFSGRTPSGSSGLLLGLDGVQEFQVLLNNYKAEFGKNSGGVVRVATRSGSNQFHGSVFEYLRNSRLDARNFFDLPGDIPPFQRNQFGAALGGPLRRDRSFFFLNYEGLRERKAITSVATVPAAGVRSRAVPAVLPYLNLYPLPNGPLNPDGSTASLTTSVTQPAREDFGLVRLDHRLSDGISLLARVSVQDSFLESPFASTPVPGFPQTLPHRNVFTLLGATAAFGASAVNEFHFAFNRTFQAALLPPPPDGLTLSPVPGRDFGILIVPGISNLGGQTFVRSAALNLFEVSDNFSVRRGRHSQKYGVSVQRYQANEQRGSFFNGQYSFSNLNQFLTLAPSPAPTPVFVGVLGGANAAGVASPAGWRWTAFNGFAQDDVQLLPNLTVNFGLRYEFSSTPSEVNGLSANLRSPLDPEPTVGGQLFNTIARSWAPRIGFAWSPLPGRDAALRGGYGVFFNPLVVNMYGNSRLVPPFVEIASILRAPFPNPLATGLTPNRSTTGQSIDYTLSPPYTQHWNLQWQQRVLSNWVATAAYVGNRTLHLIRSLESNSAIPEIDAAGAKFFPAGTPRRNPNFGAIRGRSSNGNSWYNALQLTLEKRYTSGWGFEAVYTWGKSLSTGDSSFTTLPSQPSNTQDPEDPALDKTLSAFDTRHRLVTHLLWQVPRIGGATLWNRVIGDWSVSAIASFSSGYPFSVIDGFNRSRNQQSDATIIADRPHWNPDFRGDPILGDPARWFDPAAFVLQPAGYYGNVPRNALTGPGFANLDLSLGKRFSLGEPREFEFRADFFNLTNRPNFATPSSGTGAQIVGGVIVFPDASGSPAGNAGQIFRTVTDSRQIQFSLRYRF
jgi:hypothetical protein